MSVPSTDVTITAPRTCDSMQSSIDRRQRGGGDGDDGERHVGRDRRAASARRCRPPTVSWRGLTGNTAPVAPAVTCRQSASPTEPGVSLAPTTAIVRGSSRRAMARESARCSRRSTESRNSSVSSSEKSRSTTPLSKRRSTGQPARLNTASIGRLSASTSAVKRVMPLARAIAARCSRSSVAMPLPWCCVVDHEGGVGVVAAGPALVAGPGDELAVALDDEGHPVDHVDVREVLEVGVAQARAGREVAAVDALRRLALVERRQRRGVVGADRADVDRLAVAEDDVARPPLVGCRRRAHGGDDGTAAAPCGPVVAGVTDGVAAWCPPARPRRPPSAGDAGRGGDGAGSAVTTAGRARAISASCRRMSRTRIGPADGADDDERGVVGRWPARRT